VKSAEEIMEILEAYDLTGSLRDAAELAGCSHHTVAHYVAARERGELTPGRGERRDMLVDPYLEKLEEWVERSRGKVRADVAHEKLIALGYTGSERTTRRAVAEAKGAYRAGRRRVHRPWTPEPGMWLQYDFGDGPRVGGVATQLFCAWLAWCRFRVVLALLDKTVPSVMAAIDQALRIFGGVPTYALTDNEKTVTVEHVAGIPVRNAQMVDFARHYGLVVATCVPADPASKGGSENAVKIAKADLVPCEANLLPGYASFAELEQACGVFCEQVNARPHRVTRRAPAEMLAEERQRLHPLPPHPYTAAFGVTRTVPLNTPMIAFEHGAYSVPHTLAGQTVWVRPYRDQVVITHVGDAGPVEVARHDRTTPGSPRVDDAHFPAPAGGPAGADAAPTDRRRGALPGARRRRGVVADRGRRGGLRTDPGEDGRGGRPGRVARPGSGGSGARASRGHRPVRARRPGRDPDSSGRRRPRQRRDQPRGRGQQPGPGHRRLDRLRPRGG